MSRWRLRLARRLGRRRSAPPAFAAVLGRALGDEDRATLRLATFARTLPAAPAAGLPHRRRAAAIRSAFPDAAEAARTPKE